MEHCGPVVEAKKILTCTCDKDRNSSVTTSAKTKPFNYACVVLVAAFIAYSLATLLSSCFGIFFDSMATELRLSKSKIAFIGACLSSLDNLLGPISSAFINRYGCRKTCIIGGLFSSCGIIASSYQSEFWLIGLFMGIVSGFGTSLVLVSCVVIVTYYFEDRPSFASGFVISGGSFGQSVFSLLIIKLNEYYGRSGCFLIIGGLLLNIVVCGALFRYNDKADETDETEVDEYDLDEEPDLDLDLDSEETKKSDNNSLYVCDIYDAPEKPTIDTRSSVTVNSPRENWLRRVFRLKANEKAGGQAIQPAQVQHSQPISATFRMHAVDHHANLSNLRFFYYKSLVHLNTRLMTDDQSHGSKQQCFDSESFNQLSMSCPSLIMSTASAKTNNITINELNYRFDRYRYLMEMNSMLEKADNEADQDGKASPAGLATNAVVSRTKKLCKRLFNSITQTLKLFGIFEFAIFVLCNFILSLFYEAPFW